MDIRTLPEQEREIYNRLKKNYSLHFKSLKVGKYHVRLLKPSDMEELLDRRDSSSDFQNFPFWAKLWEASIVLAHLLAAGPKGRGSRLLELGSGLGLGGIVASAAGFEVVMSDAEQIVLDFQRVSSAANREAQIEHQILNWQDPPQMRPFDVIAGAEILAEEELFDPLIDMCRKFLEENGTIFLAHDVKRKSLPLFLQKAERFFTVGSRKQSIRNNGVVVDILVNRLQRK